MYVYFSCFVLFLFFKDIQVRVVKYICKKEDCSLDKEEK